MRLRLVLALCAPLGIAAPRAAAEPRPRPLTVELLLAGPGDELYTRFGHSALRVRGGGRFDLVYNYGYTNFGGPGLIPRFLRGRARFWVAALAYPVAVRDYRDEDRSLYLRPLRLSPSQTTELVTLLETNARPENRAYAYHHYDDNCATRLRDLVDRVTRGALRERLAGMPSGHTLRDLTRAGFAGRLGVLLLTELLVGRRVDEPIDRWRAAFLPRLLDQELRDAGLAEEWAAILHRRGAPSPLDHDPLAGVKLLWAAAALSVLLAAGMALLARRRSRWSGLVLLVLALPLGLAALLIWALAIYSSLPELRGNELLLVLWPTDLALLWPAVRWLRGRLHAGRPLRVYATIRAGVIALAALGHLVGVLVQQPRAWLLASAALAVGLLLALRALPRAPGPTSSTTAGAQSS